MNLDSRRCASNLVTQPRSRFASSPRLSLALLLSATLFSASLFSATLLQGQPIGTGIDLHAEDLKRIEQPRDPAASGDAAMSLDQLMEHYTTPALGVAVVKDYKLLWAKTYGYADKEAGRKANVDTLFQAASISKPVSAMAVLRAVQDGRFGLDDDINAVTLDWIVGAGWSSPVARQAHNLKVRGSNPLPAPNSFIFFAGGGVAALVALCAPAPRAALPAIHDRRREYVKPAIHAQAHREWRSRKRQDLHDQVRCRAPRRVRYGTWREGAPSPHSFHRA